MSFRPLPPMPRRCAETVPAVNVAALIGHSALRLAMMTDIARKASTAEVASHAAILSTRRWTMAPPASRPACSIRPTAAADDDEVSARSPVAFASHGGIYATHMRDEFDRVLDSIDETCERRQRRTSRVVISHHKCAGPANWGRTRETLPRLEAAASSQPVNLDVYPYTAGSTNLRVDLVTTGLSDPDFLVEAASGDDRAATCRTSPGNGAAICTRRRGGLIPPAPSISRWTRPTCAA